MAKREPPLLYFGTTFTLTLLSRKEEEILPLTPTKSLLINSKQPTVAAYHLASLIMTLFNILFYSPERF